MKLTLTRFDFQPDRTIGRMTFDGDHRHFWTLEDKVREVPEVPVEVWKVPGQTAIPQGTYNLVVDYSPRFKKLLPRLLGVSGFTGVRIHSGNTPDDTEGCILVGATLSEDGTRVLDSRAAMGELLNMLDAAIDGGQRLEIEIGT